MLRLAIFIPREDDRPPDDDVIGSLEKDRRPSLPVFSLLSLSERGRARSAALLCLGDVLSVGGCTCRRLLRRVRRRRDASLSMASETSVHEKMRVCL